MSHAKQEAPGAPEAVKGITVHDSDMLEPEPVRPGGLMRKDAVRTLNYHGFILDTDIGAASCIQSAGEAA